ncbi:helix-turn-helix transcriptional regulator [bacterium]|nr:helix-turn-helix transcriptional regulator [bacterium]
MANLSSEQCKQVLKLLMKQKSKTYKDLAEHLNLSEVSVKRIMSKEDLSFSRFMEICNWLEVSLSEIEKLANYGQTNQKVRFTEKQEQFLVKNPEYLSFLFNMYVEDDPEKVRKKFNISEKSMNLYLLRLEKHELIKKVSGQYRPVSRDVPSPIPYGNLIRYQYKNVLESGIYFFKRLQENMDSRKNPEHDKGNHTNLGVYTLKRESYLAWFEKYKTLHQELSNTSTIEEKMPGLKNKKAVVIMHCHGVVEEKDPSLEGIINMFGQVKELAN